MIRSIKKIHENMTTFIIILFIEKY